MPKAQKAMGFEDDLRRVEEHVAEARRTVHRQKGLITVCVLRAWAHGMLKGYFGCWSPTYGDWRNTETASEQTSGRKAAAPFFRAVDPR